MDENILMPSGTNYLVWLKSLKKTLISSGLDPAIEIAVCSNITTLVDEGSHNITFPPDIISVENRALYDVAVRGVTTYNKAKGETIKLIFKSINPIAIETLSKETGYLAAIKAPNKLMKLIHEKFNANNDNNLIFQEYMNAQWDGDLAKLNAFLDLQDERFELLVTAGVLSSNDLTRYTQTAIKISSSNSQHAGLIRAIIDPKNTHAVNRSNIIKYIINNCNHDQTMAAYHFKKSSGVVNKNESSNKGTETKTNDKPKRPKCQICPGKHETKDCFQRCKYCERLGKDYLHMMDTCNVFLNSVKKCYSVVGLSSLTPTIKPTIIDSGANTHIASEISPTTSLKPDIIAGIGGSMIQTQGITDSSIGPIMIVDKQPMDIISMGILTNNYNCTYDNNLHRISFQEKTNDIVDFLAFRKDNKDSLYYLEPQYQKVWTQIQGNYSGGAVSMSAKQSSDYETLFEIHDKYGHCNNNYLERILLIKYPHLNISKAAVSSFTCNDCHNYALRKKNKTSITNGANDLHCDLMFFMDSISLIGVDGQTGEVLYQQLKSKNETSVMNGIKTMLDYQILDNRIYKSIRSESEGGINRNTLASFGIGFKRSPPNSHTNSDRAIQTIKLKLNVIINGLKDKGIDLDKRLLHYLIIYVVNSINAMKLIHENKNEYTFYTKIVVRNVTDDNNKKARTKIVRYLCNSIDSKDAVICYDESTRGIILRGTHKKYLSNNDNDDFLFFENSENFENNKKNEKTEICEEILNLNDNNNNDNITNDNINNNSLLSSNVDENDNDDANSVYEEIMENENDDDNDINSLISTIDNDNDDDNDINNQIENSSNYDNDDSVNSDDSDNEESNNYPYNLRPRATINYKVFAAYTYNLSKVIKNNDNKLIHLAQQELQLLHEKKVFEINDIKPNNQIINSTMIFSDKARFCACDVSKIYSTSFDLAPTVDNTSIKFFLIRNINKLMATIDVRRAFLNVSLPADSNVLIRLDKHALNILETIDAAYKKVKRNEKGYGIVRLRRALYGLSNSAALFYSFMLEKLDTLNLKPLKTDPCYFASESKDIELILHVDDIMVACSNKDQLNKLISEINALMEIKYNIITEYVHFLGLDIHFQKDQISISQSDLIDKILNASEVKSTANTPFTNNLFKDEDNNNSENISYPNKINTSKLFHRIVMQLNYLIIHSRFDLTMPVVFLQSKVQNPKGSDFKKLHRIIEYLNLTKDQKFVIKPNNNYGLAASADASYSIHTDLRSQLGFIISYKGVPLLVKSKKQDIRVMETALSSTDAEIFAAHLAIKAICWFRAMLEEMQVALTPTSLEQDNASAIRIMTKGYLDGKSKHLNIKIMYQRDKILNGQLLLVKNNTDFIIADPLTKPTTTAVYQKWSDEIMNSKIVL